jgi:4-amino-4-deoxy-L-arabinose transferase-like glycosyltransferase
MTRLFNAWANPRAIYVVVALFVALGVLYAVTTPLFEAGDELWHYPHVQWIARGNGLPVQDPTQKQLWEQEGGQPPLYYVTSAALTFWIDTRDMQDRLWRNPYAKIGIPLAYGNKNMIVHTSAENFPWHNTALAVHLIRLLSVLFSAGTVFLTYKIARELFAAFAPTLSAPLSLLAACIVAFNPMFLFISASVNNDSLAALTATGALDLIVQLATRGATNRRLLATGIVCGLALLSKVSNVAVMAVAGAVVVWLVWRARDWKLVLRGGGLILVPVALLAGWWFARNYFLYGDPLAFNVWLQIAGGRAPQTLLGLLDEFQGFRISFWGNFGGVNVIAPDWVYATLDVFSALAWIGLGIGFWLSKGGAMGLSIPSLLWIPALHLVSVFVALIRWTLLTYASQGRLIFPAMAAVGILMAVGLYAFASFVSSFLSRRTKWRNSLLYFSPLILPALLALLLFVFAVAAPFWLIAPVYAQPARWANDAAVPNPVHIRFDADGAQPELVGYDVARFVQDDVLPLTLYWRTDAPIAEDLAMYVHVYDVNGNSIGQWDAFPGNGLAPTRLWRPHEILVDHYRVPLTPTRASPPIGRVEVGLARAGTTRPLVARDPSGQAITPTLARFKLAQAAGSPVPTRVALGDELGLVDLRLDAQRGAQTLALDANSAQTLVLQPGEVLKLSPVLQARQIPNADYVLFVHVVDAQGSIVAQRDAQPLNNTYPTSLWNANEQVRDTLRVEIPRDASAGNYTLELGAYRADTLTRLPINGANWGIWQVQSDHLAAPLEIAP